VLSIIREMERANEREANAMEKAEAQALKALERMKRGD
jgi:hypothetical protein